MTCRPAGACSAASASCAATCALLSLRWASARPAAVLRQPRTAGCWLTLADGSILKIEAFERRLGTLATLPAARPFLEWLDGLGCHMCEVVIRGLFADFEMETLDILVHRRRQGYHTERGGRLVDYSWDSAAKLAGPF